MGTDPKRLRSSGKQLGTALKGRADKAVASRKRPPKTGDRAGDGAKATRYRYSGRNLESGDKVSGVVSAFDAQEAKEVLRERGIVPESVAATSAAASLLSTDVSLGRNKVKPKELATVARQLAVTEGSGLSTFVAIKMIAQELPDGSPTGAMLRDVHKRVSNGENLGAAFGHHEDKIGHLGVALISAGDASSTLDRTLVQWADMSERQLKLTRKVRSAMTYPLAILGLAIAATLASLIFVIPTFENVYKDFGADLPTLTKILLSVSHFLKRILILIPLVPIGLVFAWKRARKDKEIGPKIDAALLRVPLVGPILHKSVIGRFADVLSVTLQAGVPTLSAIDMAAATAGNRAVMAAIGRARQRFQEGQKLSTSFQDEWAIPQVLPALLAQGEATSNAEELLARFAEMTQSEVEAKVTALTDLLQPAMLLLVFGLVGILGIGIYLPILGLYDQFTG